MSNTILWKYYFLIFAFGQSFCVFGQNPNLTEEKISISSIYKKINSFNNEASKLGLEKEFDSAVYFSQRAIKLSKESKNSELISFSNLTKAKLLYWQDSTSVAKSILDQCLKEKK